MSEPQEAACFRNFVSRLQVSTKFPYEVPLKVPLGIVDHDIGKNGGPYGSLTSALRGLDDYYM